MQNKNILIAIVLSVVAIVAIVAAVSFFQALKKSEFDFNQKKATLVKDNLDLKDRLESMQDLIIQKTDAAAAIEKEKKILEEELAKLKKENDRLIASTNEEIESLKQKSLVLEKKISTLENSSIVQRLREAIDQENNENIKKVLGDSLKKIELIKEGKSVNLEPIVVKETNAFQPPPVDMPLTQNNTGKNGTILSLDKKSSLVVINLGRKEDIKEGDRINIFKDGALIAGGEIISVRYRISAAVIDDVQYKSTINDIREGCEVTVPEQ